MKTESDNEIENLQTMWKHIKSRMESKNDDSEIFTQQPQIPIKSPYATKNYQVQISALQDELFMKNQKLITSQQQLNSLNEDNQQMSDEIEQLRIENQLIKQKMELIESQIDTIQDEKESIKLIRLENDQLREDVKRLIEMLKQTKEFNTIGIDSTQTYIKGNVKLDQRKFKLDEENWVPMKCIELMQGIENKEEILLQLSNSIHNNYKDKIYNLRETSNGKIEELKRSLANRQTVDSIQQQKQIERLKKQQQNKNNSKDNIAQLQDCFGIIKEKEAIIIELKNKILDLEHQIQNDEQYTIIKKQFFVEGAQWILAKIMDEVVAYEISLNELNYDVGIKIESLLVSEDVVQQQIINKVYSWITETQRELCDAFKSKLQVILNTTNSKIQQ